MSDLSDKISNNKSVEDLLMEFVGEMGKLSESKEYKEAGLFKQTILYSEHVGKYASLIKTSVLLSQ